MSLKTFNPLLLMLLACINQSICAIAKCEKSVTTTSGTKAVNEKKVCSGDLIFEESFDGTLDMDIWQHDITFTGDSVRTSKLKLRKCKYSEFFHHFYRLTSSSGTQTIAPIPLLRMEI